VTELISLVIPARNERDNLGPLLSEIEGALESTEFEALVVDDGSTDGTLEELRRLRARHSWLRVLSLEAHAGQSAALAAGFDAASGGVLVTLDADCQNDPADIPVLLKHLAEDARLSAVVGYRATRADSKWKRIQSRIANSVRNQLTGDRVRDTGCPLKAMRREKLLSVPRFDGMHRFLPTLIRLSGGRVAEVPVSHRPRLFGGSKYGMRNRALRALRDALGVRWLGLRALRYGVREESGEV
jgi:glycosyltransferase involved in cell wall biosynthesis